jgi:hypothetical protein
VQTKIQDDAKSATNEKKCGRCGIDCTALANIDTATCVSGTCEVTCKAGFLNCDCDPGCETEGEVCTAHKIICGSK